MLSLWAARRAIKKKKSHQSYRRAIRIQLQVRTWRLKASTCSFERQKRAGALPRRGCAWGAGFAQTMPEAAQIPQNSAQEPNRQRTTSNPGSRGAAGSCPRRGRWGLLVARGQRQGGERGLRWGCGRKGVVMVTNDWYSPKEARFRFNRGKTQGRRKG